MQITDALLDATQACGGTVEQFIHAWADWCDGRYGAGEIRSTTIREYLSGSTARITPRVASSLYEFLGVIESRGLILDQNSLKPLETKLWRDIAADRERVYVTPLQNDLTAEDEIRELFGCYLVLRFETGEHRYQEELLILDGRKSKRKWINRATYIRPQLIYRGPFFVLDSIICCTLGAFSSSGHPRTNTIHLSRDGNNRTDIICGLLSGAGTGSRVALTMPVIALRIRKLPKNWQKISQATDAFLTSTYSTIRSIMSSDGNRFLFLKEIEAAFNLAPTAGGTGRGRGEVSPYRAVDINSYADAIRPLIGNPALLVNPAIIEWMTQVLNRASFDE